MSSRSRWVFSVAAAIAFASQALAQKSPLELIPAQSPIVIHVRGYEQTFARLNAVLKASAPDYAPLLAGKIENGVAGLLNGRELKAMPKEGPLFLVFTELPTGDTEIPELALIAKVTSYTKFRDGLLKDDEKKDLKASPGYESTKIEDREIFFLDLDGYVVVTPSEKAMKLFRDKKTKNLAAALDKTLAGKLLGADVSAYVDVKALTKQFGDQIDSAKTLVGQALDQLEGAGLDKGQIEMVKKIYDGIFRLVDDTERFVAGVEFRPDGFMLRLHTQVGDKTKTNEFLKASRPTKLEMLGKLPTGKMSYMSGSADLDFIRGLALAAIVGLPGGGPSDQPLADASKALANLKLKNWVGANDHPNISLQVFQYEDNQAAVKATMKMYQILRQDASFGGAIIKGKPEIKADAEKLGGFTFHSVKITWDFDKTVEKFPEQLREAMKAALKTSLGDGAHDWFGTDGKVLLQVRAPDWPAARKMIDSYLNGKATLGADPSYLATRKQLPETASSLIIFDARRTAYVTAKSIAEMGKNFPGALPGNAPKAQPGKPTYIGLALGMQPQNGTLDLWLPADAIKAFIKVFGPMFGGVDG